MPHTLNHDAAGGTVAILGTGAMARALGNLIKQGGAYDVVYGSRRPEEAGRVNTGRLAGRVLTTQAAIDAADSYIVILAVPPGTAKCVLGSASFGPGMAFVDISNPDLSMNDRMGLEKRDTPSAATQLQTFLDQTMRYAHVVKAFNNVGAYEVEAGIIRGSSPSAYIASSSSAAANAVALLARSMGMQPVLVGGLQKARWLEQRQGQFFPEWVLPGAITLLLFFFWFVYTAVRALALNVQYSQAGVAHQPELRADQLPFKIMNTTMASLAGSLLCVVYLPGLLVSCMQLHNRSCHHPLPRWLRAWMSCRKQLGMLCFYCSIMHTIMSCILVSLPEYRWSFYKDDGLMTWMAEMVLLLGVFALMLLSIAAYCSNPAVAPTMAYMEWRIVFSWVGWTVLTLVFCHNLLFDLTFHYCPSCTSASIGDDWPENTTGGVVPPASWITMGMAGFTLALKLVLTLPPLGLRLAAIRGTTWFTLPVKPLAPRPSEKPTPPHSADASDQSAVAKAMSDLDDSKAISTSGSSSPADKPAAGYHTENSEGRYRRSGCSTSDGLPPAASVAAMFQDSAMLLNSGLRDRLPTTEKTMVKAQWSGTVLTFGSPRSAAVCQERDASGVPPKAPASLPIPVSPHFHRQNSNAVWRGHSAALSLASAHDLGRQAGSPMPTWTPNSSIGGHAAHPTGFPASGIRNTIRSLTDSPSASTNLASFLHGMSAEPQQHVLQDPPTHLPDQQETGSVSPRAAQHVALKIDDEEAHE